jgi:hypothetical protein
MRYVIGAVLVAIAFAVFVGKDDIRRFRRMQRM